MDLITPWLNAAGSKAIDKFETAELLAELARTTNQKERTRLTNKICEGNLKLVYSTVKNFSDHRRLRWGNELSADLLQVGFLGLHHAVGRYDASRGTKLSTVAVPWIRQKLGRYLIQKAPAIYIPEHVVREVVSLKKTGKLTNSRTTPKDTRLVDMATYAYGHIKSLDIRLNGEEDGSTLADLLPQPSTEGSARRQDEAILFLKEKMAQAGIEPRTQDLMIGYARRGRLAIVAQKMRVSPTHARRLVNGAIERMQALV